ncbi:MAG TPA: hypothetical protein VK712_03185 [Verrucomicrobiae bacterium]|jgi:hypothetical protein|nr:hypothetical protein [Verrucomicrobiae bacterium]
MTDSNHELALSTGEVTAAEALERHEAAWRAVLDAQELQALGGQVIATTLSWKVKDKAELFAILQQNATAIEQVHIGTVNDRYIASAALYEPFRGLPILKLLERRPGSVDPLGLDSVDYLVDDLELTFAAFQGAGLDIVKEHNDMHDWLSLRFGANQEFEAKITDHLVLAVGVKELQLASQQILSRLQA